MTFLIYYTGNKWCDKRVFLHLSFVSTRTPSLNQSTGNSDAALVRSQGSLLPSCLEGNTLSSDTSLLWKTVSPINGILSAVNTAETYTRTVRFLWKMYILLKLLKIVSFTDKSWTQCQNVLWKRAFTPRNCRKIVKLVNTTQTFMLTVPIWNQYSFLLQ